MEFKTLLMISVIIIISSILIYYYIYYQNIKINTLNEKLNILNDKIQYWQSNISTTPDLELGSGEKSLSIEDEGFIRVKKLK
ncbi:hypothetical protein AHEV_072 [Adoxophyes honmai entomopoxvirus 'L']|uniref:Uncharacterized protein n=1 Tax=Adoxophyes honmai entomopoxvirus 'L' TaxID=1293540 RepID=A0A916NWS5_9POXV|nr:hypothetical protein AHEV_072 [Adoxophyes honmai entomopoxvirus 'L']CCU55393.1 hypothetical protein AHEV_072 [Adoxophyes honmai entomopoxvirus 'L']